MLSNMISRVNGNRPSAAQYQDETDIDITPMLDVVFIMLIFFIVTASFLKESGFGINTPPVTSPTIEPPKVLPIVLEIDANNEIRIQNTIVSQAAIRATIIRLKAESPDAPVVVTLHPKALTRTMVAAIDGVRAANVLLPSVSLRRS